MEANAPILRVSHWRPNDSNDAVECVSDTHPQFESRSVAVIVPGSWKGPPPAEVIQCLVQWLLKHHSAGATLCSVCGGAFVLAETGLLAGRSATTHWSYTAKLAESFPDVHVDESRITVEDGNFITARGVLAWTDLGLKLVARGVSRAAECRCARSGASSDSVVSVDIIDASPGPQRVAGIEGGVTMSNLLDLALAAHGGLDRWNRLYPQDGGQFYFSYHSMMSPFCTELTLLNAWDESAIRANGPAADIRLSSDPDHVGSRAEAPFHPHWVLFEFKAGPF
jgi:putative intracellular protease/amidase